MILCEDINMELTVREEEDWLQIRRVTLPGETSFSERQDIDPQQTEAMFGVSEVDIAACDTQELPLIPHNGTSISTYAPQQTLASSRDQQLDLQDTLPRTDIARLPTTRLKQTSEQHDDDVSQTPTRRLHGQDDK